MEFVNLATVCCVLLPVDDGLLLIRRNRKGDPGFGKIALPGGFQKGNIKQNMWDAAIEEVLEETGIQIHKSSLSLFWADTDEYEHNVIFFLCNKLIGSAKFYMDRFKPIDDEVSELVYINGPVETAFPFHDYAIKRYFDGE